jgi:conjugative relaxase-like TrwC/TraI family protein
MLNMKAMPAAGGDGLAAYLWKEATSLNAPELPAKQDLDCWVAEGTDYEDLVEFAYAERLARVQAAMPVEPWHALHGLSDVGIDHELLRDKARDDVDAAFARYDVAQAEQLATFGVEYRADTAPELAELLKIDLQATPQLQDLKHLLSGLAADGQQPDGKMRYRTSGERKTMGSLELVFSADKSVSVYGQGANRAAIVNAQRKAVDAAMQQIAGKLGFLRVRRDGIDHHDPADMTWIQWQHRFSRHGQPQIHTHVSIPNVVRSRTEIGKVGTLNTFALHGFYPTARETYHRVLVKELGKLGLPVQFDARVPAAVLTNVTDQERRQFSSRTVIAEKAAAEYIQDKHSIDFDSLTPKQKSAWVGRAAWHTRPRTKESNQPENVPIRFQATGEHRQRGWWRYDELQRGRGLSTGHKL